MISITKRRQAAALQGAAQHKQRTALLIALIAGVAGTIQYHSQQFLSCFDTFFGDRGDVRGFAYFCEHWYQSILGRASLLSPGIFYPTKHTLAYSDLLFGFALPYSFFRFLGFGIFSSVEITIILVTFSSYCVMFVLLYRTLGLGLVPSCVGAMFFAFNSPKFNQLTHLQLQYVLLLPVIFGLVITFAKRVETMDQRRAALLLSLAAVCFNVQLATAFYYAWFLVFWTILFFLLALAFRNSREFIFNAAKKFWPALLIATAVLLVGFIPVVLLYVPNIRPETWYRYDFVNEMIPDWRALLSMGDGNYLWGRLYAALMPDPRPSTWGELMVGIGLIPSLAWIALTVASIWLIKTRRNLGLLFLGIMILATTLFYLIGFKYAGHSPWAYVYQYFPGGGAIRAVSRYVLFLTLPVSIAFAYGLDRAIELAGKRRALALAIILLAAFGLFEQFGVHRINGAGFSKSVDESYLKAMAARLPNDCTAFYVAPGPQANHATAEYHYDAMMISALTRVRTLNASSSQFPVDWNMYFLKNPDYESNVKSWIDSHRISGKVCRLELAPEVEAFNPSTPSPIDDPEFFVRQLYRDFTGQEPEAQVVQAQAKRIKNCRVGDQTCERAQVALNVFLATGFHERGFFIMRMYEAGLGRAPSYDEFTKEMGRFNDRTLAEFAQAHNLNEQSLRERVESDELVRTLGNRSFVMLHYFGFLHRNPETSDVNYWLNILDRRGDATRITDGFINSVEYRDRFRH